MKRLGLFGLLAVLAISCGGGGTAVSGVAGPATSGSPGGPTTTIQLQDKGIRVQSLQLKPEGGYFGGTAEVRNSGTRTKSAAMRFTFTKNGKLVGAADALAQNLAPGQTVTVQLNSTDQWDGSPVTTSFAVNQLY